MNILNNDIMNIKIYTAYVFIWYIVATVYACEELCWTTSLSTFISRYNVDKKCFQSDSCLSSLSPFHIPQKGRDATPYLERNKVGRDAIDSAAALTDMGKYLFIERRLPTYDIAVVVTRFANSTSTTNQKQYLNSTQTQFFNSCSYLSTLRNKYISNCINRIIFIRLGGVCVMTTFKTQVWFVPTARERTVHERHCRYVHPEWITNIRLFITKGMDSNFSRFYLTFFLHFFFPESVPSPSSSTSRVVSMCQISLQISKKKKNIFKANSSFSRYLCVSSSNC